MVDRRLFPPQVRAEVIRLACERPADSEVPLARWSSRELAAEVVTRGICEQISGITVVVSEFVRRRPAVLVPLKTDWFNLPSDADPKKRDSRAWTASTFNDFDEIFAHANFDNNRKDGGPVGLYAWLRLYCGAAPSDAYQTLQTLISDPLLVSQIQVAPGAMAWAINVSSVVPTTVKL